MNSHLIDLIHSEQEGFLLWSVREFKIVEDTPSHEANRETLARLYQFCTTFVEKEKSPNDANIYVRAVWIEEVPIKRSKHLSRIIMEDGFLRLFVQGEAVTLSFFRRIWLRLQKKEEKMIRLNPIQIEWNDHAERFFDVDATPPGFLPKLFARWRLKMDAQLLEKIIQDLVRIAEIDSKEKRCFLTLAVLSHGGAYRELQGSTLYLPNFEKRGELIAYSCEHHHIGEGLKTVSLIPNIPSAPPIYLCQGTELWPSQPSVLGSVTANFAVHGAATEAYAHSWRRIHIHLRQLKTPSGPLPFVAGHSMGGALAMQIGLYSHGLIEKSYAFNPPLPNERDWKFYHNLPSSLQNKIEVSANLDDFAFWRIGAKLIGQVTIFLGKKRWRYYHITIWDALFFIPAFIKFILNIRHAFPAHQRILSFSPLSLSIKLTPEEMERENLDRIKRYDYMRFFPKLYDPLTIIVRWVRTLFGWRFKEQYLKNEIEILTLHEQDLYDTMTVENQAEMEKELAELRRQKEALKRRLKLET